MQHFKDFNLKNYTSFKIGGKAKNVYFPETNEEFIQLLKNLQNPIILGGMSNVIISSNGINQDVILTKKLSHFEIKSNTIYAQAGAMGPLISKAAAKASLSGMEFMCGFPGSIGGMVCMNASAHNQSIANIFTSATVFDQTKKTIKTLLKNDIQFDYRKSILQSKNYILIDANFTLDFKPAEEINAQMQANKEFRANKQPNLSKPNCGSVFKNPKNFSAGKLLEDSGAKLLSYGEAKVYENHANFIINTGNAKSEDVSHLIKNMYNIVNEKFKIKLQPEVKFIGEMSKEEQKIWNELLRN